MSLKPSPIEPIPSETIRVAQAAFPEGNPYLTLRDKLGTIFVDEDFSNLYPERGQPAWSPWRLALVTIMQFRENLSDRQAAEAVRGRIDWKYLLGLELSDPGFNFSILSEFRDRLIQGGAEGVLLDQLLEQCLELGLVKAGGKQRTDSTYILAAVKELTRIELVGEALRAALNQLAVEVPEWLRTLAPAEWYKRYGRRIEEQRIPRSKAKKKELVRTIGEDGFRLLDAVDHPGAPEGISHLSQVAILRRVWDRHYKRQNGQVRYLKQSELSSVKDAIESPYDSEARYCRRSEIKWVGYRVHLSETCDEETPHLLTHTYTTLAGVHEINTTTPIQQALIDKEIPPDKHIVDSAYVDAERLVSSRREQQIDLVGPARINPNWQSATEGGYGNEAFEIDWDKQQVRCPQNKRSNSWRQYRKKNGSAFVQVRFSRRDCVPCPARELCTRAKYRTLKFFPHEKYEALRQARLRQKSEEGKQLAAQRNGVEGTISPAVRAFGLRRTRYRGLAKTALQHVATAAAINIDRLFNWFNDLPRGQTSISHFAALGLSQ